MILDEKEIDESEIRKEGYTFKKQHIKAHI